MHSAAPLSPGLAPPDCAPCSPQIKYTGFRDRPHEERQARFQNACRDGRSEIVSGAALPSGPAGTGPGRPPAPVSRGRGNGRHRAPPRFAHPHPPGFFVLSKKFRGGLEEEEEDRFQVTKLERLALGVAGAGGARCAAGSGWPRRAGKFSFGEKKNKQKTQQKPYICRLSAAEGKEAFVKGQRFSPHEE